MKFWRELASAAGFGLFANQLLALLLLACSLIGFLVYIATGIAGLALSISLLTLGVGLEVLRALGTARTRALEQVWPSIFDLLRSGAEAGLSSHEQIEYLSKEAPVSVRRYFQQLFVELERGQPIRNALTTFQQQVGSRSGDFLALVFLITSELGGRGESGIWARASSDIRAEQQLLGQVLAKQGWVLGSAKLAVLAPWLIVFVLLSVPSNKEAFSSPTGTLILLLGLLLSVFAYFLTSLLGRLPMPERVFNVG
jgi:tight adherence protein B